MPSISLLIVFYFLVVAFTSSPAVQGITNPFLSYFDLQFRFILGHLLLFVLAIIGLVLLFIRSNIQRKHKIFLGFSRFVKRTVAIFIIGSLVSFTLLFAIALVEVNILSALTYTNIKLLGVETDAQVISESLKKNNSPPIVIAGGSKGNVLPLSIAIAQSGKSGFYGSRIVPFVPATFIIPAKKPDAGVFLIGKSLVITELNSPEFQKVSPVVSYLMISKYFPGRNIRSYPNVALMGKDEYLTYRKDDFDSKLQKFDELIAQINSDSESLSASIDELKNQVSDNQSKVKEANLKKEKEYTKCINTGTYKSGVFYKNNTFEYCQEQITPLEDSLKQLITKGDELNTTLEDNQTKLTQYKTYITFYSQQKLLTQEESTYISYEFGTFNPPDVIKIALTLRNGSQATGDYFELLVHEYLHYACFDENGKTITSTFFKEGLTEYFARRIIKSNLGVDTNLGYPVNVKIIDQITKRIAESDLADIYFNNDQAGLQKLLDRVYGTGFYKKNLVLFETLQYSSDTKQILQIANDIMSEIGGSPLGESDLNTTYSTFQ
jgi:hypothetical protein